MATSLCGPSPRQALCITVPTLLEQVGPWGLWDERCWLSCRCRVNAVQTPGTSKNGDELWFGEKEGVWKRAYKLSHLARHFMGSVTHKLGGTRQPGFRCYPTQNLCRWQSGCFWDVLLVPLKLTGVPGLALLSVHRGASVWKCQSSCRPGTDHTSGNKAFAHFPFFASVAKANPLSTC